MYITYTSASYKKTVMCIHTLEGQHVCARVCMVGVVCVCCVSGFFLCSVLVVLVTVGIFGCVVAKVFVLVY